MNAVSCRILMQPGCLYSPKPWMVSRLNSPVYEAPLAQTKVPGRTKAWPDLKQLETNMLASFLQFLDDFWARMWQGPPFLQTEVLDLLSDCSCSSPHILSKAIKKTPKSDLNTLFSCQFWAQQNIKKHAQQTTTGSPRCDCRRARSPGRSPPFDPWPIDLETSSDEASLKFEDLLETFFVWNIFFGTNFWNIFFGTAFLEATFGTDFWNQNPER